MSITKFSTNDINIISEKIRRIETELLSLKTEKKVTYSRALTIVDSDVNKDGDIIKDSLIVPLGKRVIFIFGFDSLYEDFTGTIYSKGENSTFLTAESSYLVWQILGICDDSFNPIQLTFTSGTKRTYKTKSIFGPGTYSDLKLYARVEQQNSTPEYRCAPYWAAWIAVEVNL